MSKYFRILTWLYLFMKWSQTNNENSSGVIICTIVPDHISIDITNEMLLCHKLPLYILSYTFLSTDHYGPIFESEIHVGHRVLSERR